MENRILNSHTVWLAWLLAASPLAGVGDQSTPVSTPDAGMKASASASGDSTVGGFSADGRWLVFASRAPDLVSNDHNGATDVFLADLQTGETRLLSVNQSGGESGNGDSTRPVITAGGHWVLFQSTARDLTTNVVSGGGDVFVRDLQTGVTKLVSVTTTGAGGELPSSEASCSADGRCVVFESRTPASSFVSGATDDGQETDVFVRDLVQGVTTLVSHAWDAPVKTASARSGAASISADGTRVAFASLATNLFPMNLDDTRPIQVYAYDLQTGANTCISTNSATVAAQLGITNRFAQNPTLTAQGGHVFYRLFRRAVLRHDLAGNSTILVTTNAIDLSDARKAASDLLASRDGRFLAFAGSTNRTSGTLAAPFEVLVWDEQTGESWSVSRAPNGDPPSSMCDPVAMTPDGRYIAFLSAATNLVDAPDDGSSQIYVADRVTGTVRLVSKRLGSDTASQGDASLPLLSDDGQRVAFQSHAPDLVLDDLNNAYDVFVRDLATESTTLVSKRAVDPAPTTPFGASGSTATGLSADGKRLAFVSFAPNLVPNDNNGDGDVFVRDLSSGSTKLVSVNADGTGSANGYSASPVISADGRVVAFTSLATNLVSGAADMNARKDVFVRDLETGVTKLVSAATNGASSGDAMSDGPSLSADGRYVAFRSKAANLVLNDSNLGYDIFVRDLQNDAIQLATIDTNGVTQIPATTMQPPLITPDGRWILIYAIRSSSHTFYVRDLQNQATFQLGKFTSISSTPRAGWSVSADSRFAFVPYNAPSSGDILDIKRCRLGTLEIQTVCTNCLNLSASPEGRFVTYQSLRVGSTTYDVFVRDMDTGATTLVSASWADPTAGSNGTSFQPLINADGSYVVFASRASNLVQTPTSGVSQIYLRDLRAGSTLLLSVETDGQSGRKPSLPVAISGDGNTVIFASHATSLIAGDANDARDLFLAKLGAGDTDRDGLPDDWEMTYFPDLSRDGSGDADGDGLSDRAELLAGTNPTRDASVLRALVMQDLEAGTSTILWSAVAGRSYRVQFKDNAEDAQWSDLPGGTVTATGTQAAMVDPAISAGVERRFYRVLLVAP